jgi:ubiquitin-protein ligase
MNPIRLQHETAILNRYFPNRFRIEQVGRSKGLLDVGVKTQSGKVYRLNIRFKSDYPNSLPEVYIVYPLPMLTFLGLPLDGPSHHMHTLQNDGPNIQLCHFKPENWNPNQSLYKVILKARIWLEAYEGHLRTGRPIDDFLNS